MKGGFIMQKLRYLSTFGLIVLIALFFAVNDVNAEVGVTDTSILVGCSNSFSGPLVYPGTQLVNNGLEAYIGYVNAQGGVNGRKILTQYYDDGYKPQNAVANTKRWWNRIRYLPFWASQGTGPVMATVKYLTQNKVPLLFPFQGVPLSRSKDHIYILYAAIRINRAGCHLAGENQGLQTHRNPVSG